MFGRSLSRLRSVSFFLIVLLFAQVASFAHTERVQNSCIMFTIEGGFRATQSKVAVFAHAFRVVLRRCVLTFVDHVLAHAATSPLLNWICRRLKQISRCLSFRLVIFFASRDSILSDAARVQILFWGQSFRNYLFS